MAGHGMMSVAEEGFSIFGRHAGCTQTTPKGVPQVVDTDAWQANFSASKLPCGVVHGPNSSAAIREHPDRIDPALRLHDRPCGIVPDYHVGARSLERFGRDHEDAAANFGYGNLPSPLEPAHITVAQAGVHGEKHHASQMCGQ